MPTDNRRISGPEKSINPLAFSKHISTSKPKDFIHRSDGRKMDDSRAVFLKTGTLSQAQGSAYIEQQGTKVICAVYGPRAVVKREEFSMKGQLTCEFKFATFSCRQRRQYQQDAEEKDYSVQLLEALEPAVLLHKFPKAQVNIFVTVLENDGCALAAAITCASVAMSDAGIEMYDLVTGCSVRLAGEVILVDPSLEEEYNAKDNMYFFVELNAATALDDLMTSHLIQEDTGVNHGNVTVGLMPSLDQIAAVTSQGEVQFDLMKKAISDCVRVCTQLYPVCQQSLVKSVRKQLQENT